MCPTESKVSFRGLKAWHENVLCDSYKWDIDKKIISRQRAWSDGSRTILLLISSLDNPARFQNIRALPPAIKGRAPAQHGSLLPDCTLAPSQVPVNRWRKAEVPCMCQRAAWCCDQVFCSWLVAQRTAMDPNVRVVDHWYKSQLTVLSCAAGAVLLSDELGLFDQTCWCVWPCSLNNLVAVQDEAYDLDDVLKAVHILQEVVLNTLHDVETQVPITWFRTCMKTLVCVWGEVSEDEKLLE